MTGIRRSGTLARPEGRFRDHYVDLLRAVSIGAVVLGHWIIAAPWVDDAGKLTLLFQVMPVFFLVGGTILGAWLLGAIGHDAHGPLAES